MDESLQADLPEGQRYELVNGVIDASPDQESRDLDEKRDDCWNVGVEEYWIIHRELSRVVVLNRVGDAWQERVFATGQEALSTALPGFSIAVAGLFPES